MGGSGTIRPSSTSTAAGFYITAAEIDNWPSGYTLDEMQAAIDAAEAIFEAAIGTFYRPLAFDLRLDGNDKDRLFLPLRQEILSVSLVSIWDEELDASWYTFDKNAIYINLGSGAGVGSPELRYRLNQIDRAGLFPWGINNVRVVGTYGAAAVPAWAKQVVTIIVRAANDPSLYTVLNGLQSETIGGYSYSLGAEFAKSNKSTGILEADNILKLFRRRKPIITAP